MAELIGALHFIRPEWFWGLAALPLFWLLSIRRHSATQSAWNQVVDSELLAGTHTENIRYSNSQLAELVGCSRVCASDSWTSRPELV